LRNADWRNADWQDGDWQNGDWQDGDWQDGAWDSPDWLEEPQQCGAGLSGIDEAAWVIFAQRDVRSALRTSAAVVNF
jgi:hypothetical protein